MTRREALAAFVSLPAVTRIAAVPMQSTDVIVVEYQERLASAAIDHIKAVLAATWPGRKMVILDNGARLSVVQGGKVGA